MARILIIGGHGKVALHLEPLLVERGDTVSAVIRNADHEGDVAATGAAPVVADIETFDLDQLTNLVSANDAIVWAAGAGGGSPERTYAVDRDAAIRTIDAAVAAGVRRFVMVSWIGSRADHGVSPDNGFFAYADAKWAADEHLRASGLDWTIVAPGALTLDAPTGRIEVDPQGDGAVPRADVAAVIAASLTDDATVGRTIRFGGGDVPIAEALHAR
ncbi:SDR family oxidoreductase [Microbacterium sp. zg-YB36]|uniref:SDR family oxidoreductase n=1 Tax=Microbacterium sp. zg-YB36 TaxID=2969407 RepID=UPI00214D0E1D|nr:SDR family oxidoreductase [Microbacterium sp. zg-YB36]MDL5350048.1 SDR family oxidoreductase [Microbacterium sp. zg-YB36]